jgi:hypothetical protein
MTAWPVAGGTVAFRKDIYELDNSGFTVGQPMPVGESSPDGQRYVLKPLPRQISVDDAEAQGTNFFSLFGGKAAQPAKAGSKPTKNIFGASLVSPGTAAKSTDSAKTKMFKASKKPGLFDWAAYRNQQAHPTKYVKKKKTIKAAPGDIPPEPGVALKKAKATAADAIPPEPVVKAKKTVAACKPTATNDCKAAN